MQAESAVGSGVVGVADVLAQHAAPAMGDPSDAMLARQPGDPPLANLESPAFEIAGDPLGPVGQVRGTDLYDPLIQLPLLVDPRSTLPQPHAKPRSPPQPLQHQPESPQLGAKFCVHRHRLAMIRST